MKAPLAANAASDNAAPGEKKPPFSSIISCTRLHLPPEAKELPEVTRGHLIGFVEQAVQLGVDMAIAVKSLEDEVQEIVHNVSRGSSVKVRVLPVPEWGAFVPALNALLGYAQRCHKNYILYQSLEVRCGPDVLQRLVDHHTRDTLVTGPELPGHEFREGENALNGRTVPWNTLALWSVRKLSLTGFLFIADGLPDAAPPSPARGRSKEPQVVTQQAVEDLDTDDELSSDLDEGKENEPWWSFGDFSRQETQAASVPAGVEEVTAVALLQHLRSQHKARAILIRLPRELDSQTSWSASWGKDEARAKWHAYKMASKVSRPAAQLEVLFQGGEKNAGKQVREFVGNVGGDVVKGLRKRVKSLQSLSGQAEEDNQEVMSDCASDAASDAGGVGDGGSSSVLKFGVVMHYCDSIPPPKHIHWLCLASFGLFTLNSSVVLAPVFRQLNTLTDSSIQSSTLAYSCLLLGGVWLPIPLSLWLTRRISRSMGHNAGMMIVGLCLFFSHVAVALSQMADSGWKTQILILARLVQGLGSGIVFLARFVLASVSTVDHHRDLQSWSFLATDFGLAIGALVPAAMSSMMYILAGESSSFSQDTLEIVLPSWFVGSISLAYVIYVYLKFPNRIPALPDRVRFSDALSRVQSDAAQIAAAAPVSRYVVLLSGTARIFVQSAILPAAAMSMRDAGWTGNFRQSIVVAAIYLLSLPFEVFVTRLRCGCDHTTANDVTQRTKVASGAIGAIALLIGGLQPRTIVGQGDAIREDGERLTLWLRIAELAVLMISLAMAAPFNASRLNQFKDAEQTTVMLEWLKAYVGRLLGPLFSVLVYSFVGYGPLLVSLCVATAVVTLTA
eukprot:TRINITY_DN30012_c0_g1_i1.p1 TRINITY_DN30012_c0_g1~~TRINITY_DN30012_c0_g1_i1.p1  ORF type:complete len:844 (-),score=188.52 TRINITY_DN30012_c0_g1_i1:414-2945(-)